MHQLGVRLTLTRGTHLAPLSGRALRWPPSHYLRLRLRSILEVRGKRPGPTACAWFACQTLTLILTLTLLHVHACRTLILILNLTLLCMCMRIGPQP